MVNDVAAIALAWPRSHNIMMPDANEKETSMGVELLNIKGLSELDQAAPVVMLNLMRFRERSLDGDGSGSDAPVEELDPLAGLRAAVLRTDSERPPWRPEQAIPADAALHSFTVEPAWLSFDEQRRGRLRAGFDADLVVLDRDPLADPPQSVADARLIATMVAGEWVHGR
jgi:cytosine/adenosine deaminase-related metal-dependent hydrolase